jgi:thioredoxin-related protein
MKNILALIFVLTSLAGVAQDNETKWYTITEVQELVKKQPRKIVIDMYTDWCGWCKKMDKETFDNPAIRQYLNNNFYAVKFNAETKDTILFNGKKYVNNSTGNRPPHELAVELLGGRMSYPTLVYLDENLKPLSTVPGYMTPAEIEPVLIYFSRNIYQNTSYDQFNKDFKTTFMDSIPFVNMVNWLDPKTSLAGTDSLPKLTLLYLFNDWCIECKIMDKTTFNNPVIFSHIDKNFRMVRFNLLSQDTVKFGEQVYINENKDHPFHQFGVMLMNGKMSSPALVVIGPKRELISVIPGYFSAASMEPILHFFKEGAYLTTTWDVYIKTFVGNVNK